MSQIDSSASVDDAGVRLRRFAIATVTAAVTITVTVGLILGLTAPVGSWPAAFGLGAMLGFWTSPLLGSVTGNGFHEIMKERAQRAEAPEPVDRRDQARHHGSGMQLGGAH